MTKPRILVSLLISLLSCTPTFAQYSKFNDSMRTMGDLLKDFEDLANRRPTDEAKLLDTARKMREHFKSCAQVFAGFGEPLFAVADNSSEFKERLKKPAQGARAIAYPCANEMAGYCEKFINLVSTEKERRGSDFNDSWYTLAGQLLVNMRARVKEGEELKKTSEELMRWLRESLQTALAMRDNSAKPADALDAGMRQLESKVAEQNMEVQRLFEQWRVLVNKELELSRREHDAYKDVQAARLASPSSSSFSSNMKSTQDKWNAAGKEHKEVAGYAYLALGELTNGVNDARSRLTELARLMNELSDFRRNASPEAISKRISDFDQWTNLFERDMSR